LIGPSITDIVQLNNIDATEPTGVHKAKKLLQEYVTEFPKEEKALHLLEALKQDKAILEIKKEDSK